MFTTSTRNSRVSTARHPRVAVPSATGVLLFEENGDRRGAVQPDPVPQFSVDHDGAAVDYSERTLVEADAAHVDDQGLSRHRCLATDANPLVAAIRLDEDIGKHPECAVRRFHDPESRVTSSIVHGGLRATAMPWRLAR